MNKKEVINFVKEMNNVWAVQNNPDGLKDYFHPRISQVMPSSSFRLTGREKIIKSFKDYLDLVRVKSYESSNFVVEIISDSFALCSYEYKIIQESDVDTTEHRGMDILTINKLGEKWSVVNMTA
jgi:hypothetical protein